MPDAKRLMVALKLADSDAGLIRYTSTVARLVGADRVHFAHVAREYDMPESVKKELPDVAGSTSDNIESNMKKEVDASLDSKANVEVKYNVRVGSPLVELLRLIRQHNIDFVLVGRSEHGGAVSERLTRKAPCSVVVVPDESTPKLETILVPVDFSDHALAALKTAAGWCRAGQCKKIICLHVYAVPPIYTHTGKTYDQFADIIRDHVRNPLQGFLDKADLEGIDVDTILIPDERPAKAIQDAVERRKPDMVVMGARGRTAAAGMFLGSVTEKTLRRTRVPLLAVKQKGDNLGLIEALLSS